MRKLISILLVVTVALLTTTGVAVADVADDRVTTVQDGEDDDMDGEGDDMDGESEDDDMDGEDGDDMDGEGDDMDGEGEGNDMEGEDEDMDDEDMDDDDRLLPVSTGVAGALALFFLGIVGAAAVRFR